MARNGASKSRPRVPGTNTGTKTKKTKKTKEGKVTRIIIPRPNTKTFIIKIEGETQLLCNNKGGLAGKLRPGPDGHRPQGVRGPRYPDKEYEGSLYRMGKDRYGFPSVAFKQAMASSVGKDMGFPQTKVMKAVFVMGRSDPALVEIKGSKPEMMEHVVRIGLKGTDVRYRGQFWPWNAELVIRYDADVLDRDAVISLLMRAGTFIGIGEMRPEKKGHTYGLFKIAG